MPKHHTEDYKISAVNYYLEHNIDMRATCEIFKCSYISLYRWIKRYHTQGDIKRKQTKKKPYKITNDITKYVLSLVKKNVNITLWEIVNLVKEKFNINLTDQTIFRILKKNKITRKRLRKRIRGKNIITLRKRRKSKGRKRRSFRKNRYINLRTSS